MTFDMTEGTDSTSTDAYDIGTILPFSLMNSEVICTPKKHVGLRDSSASKNHHSIINKKL